MLTGIDDINLSQAPDSTFKPSAVSTINGQDANEYLSQFAAANSIGNVEPHADWNDLMSSSAAEVQSDFSIFESYISFYPGETITFSFEKGTDLGPEPWGAFYTSPGPTGPLATGGDFYNLFVLGFYPASFDSNATDPCASPDSVVTLDSPSANATSTIATATATPWPNSAYPTAADIYQPDLYPYGGGFLTGYFLKIYRPLYSVFQASKCQETPFRRFQTPLANSSMPVTQPA